MRTWIGIALLAAGSASAAGRMEFLVDDSRLDRKAGVRRVLGSPRKQPEPVLKPEKPWESMGVSPTMGILYDHQEGKFKMWYRSSAPGAPGIKGPGLAQAVPSEPTSGKTRVFVCYAESGDGATWVRPSLRRVEFQGSRENNIIREINGGRDTFFYNVVKDPSDPNPARRYKALASA